MSVKAKFKPMVVLACITLVQTFTYSVTSYVYYQMNKTSDGKLTAMDELARALYRYGKSAEAYADNK